MAPLDVTIAADSSAVGAAVAEAICATIRRAGEDQRMCLLGWPVGRTPAPIVDALVDRAEAGQLDLANLIVVLMDDYVVPAPVGEAGPWRRVDVASGHSCRGSAQRELVAPLAAVLAPARQLTAERLWSPDPADPGAYEDQIRAAGGIDLFVVAVGTSDGHVALNPPGSASGSRTRVLALADTTRRDNLGTFPSFGSLDDVPTHGVTVGLATISDARQLAVVAHGPGKAPAVSRLMAASGFDERFPATIVNEHPRAQLFCDAAAASTAALRG